MTPNLFIMKKKIRKQRVARTMNAGTMTSSAFFQWLRQILRRSSMYWKPIAQVRQEARVPYIGTNKRRKYSYICSECHKEWPLTSIHVHHKIECGSLSSFEDLSEFARKLFVEKEGLVVLCNKCHDAKHNKNA